MQEPGNRQVSRLTLNAGAFSLDADLSVTPTGLLAIAALVSAILLSTAALVQAAKRQVHEKRK